MRRLALAGLAIAATSAPAAHAAFPGGNGRIAFEATTLREDTAPATDSRSIDTARPSGADRRTLRGCVETSGGPDSGDCSILYRTPAWSAGGTRVAFDAGERLALIRADGTGFRVLARRTADDGEPAWSPGGGRLVFTGAARAGGRRDLYVRGLASGRVRRLTFKGGRSPAWSERGRIAFVRRSDLYTVRDDGKGLRRITRRRGADPAWSPHGSKLVFTRGSSLYVVGSNGRGLRRLSSPGADSPSQPAWSPDGRWVAYASFDSGVWAQRLDGTGLRQVAPGGVGADYAVGSFAPDWQPLRQR